MNKRYWLEEIRKAAGFKQYEIAEKAGISRGYYSAIENGIRKAPGEVALKIATVLNFSMDKFYQEEIKEWTENHLSEIKEEVIENV